MTKGIKYFAHSSQEGRPGTPPFPSLDDQLSGPGFYPMKSSATLKDLARDIGKGQNVKVDVSNSTAIASVVAHVANYENEVMRALDIYAGNVSDLYDLPVALNEWFGMLAAVLLRGVYSLNIGIEYKELRIDGAPLASIAHAKFKELWGGYNAQDANENQFMRLAFLTLDGEKFAILDPKIGLCPFAARKSIFAEKVQWCNSAGMWQNPLETWDAGSGVSPEADYLYALLSYFVDRNQGTGDLADTMAHLMAYIEYYHSSKGADISNIGARFAGKITDDYLDIIQDPNDDSSEFPLPLRELMYKGAPKELAEVEFFTQKLLFFCLTKSQYEHIDSALGATSARPQSVWRLRNDNSHSHLCYLPPLTTKAVKLLADNNIKFDFSLVASKVNTGSQEEICCKVTVRYVLPSGCRLSKVRNYALRSTGTPESQGILYVSTLPALNFWPDIQCAPAEDWQLYYVSQFAPQAIGGGGEKALAEFFGYTDAQSSEPIYNRFKGRYRVHSLDERLRVRVEGEGVYAAGGEDVIDRTFAARKDDAVSKETWQIYRMDKRPTCVTVGMGDADCGMLAIPKKKPVPRNPEKPIALVSLDFGTTSSMLYYKLNEPDASIASVSAPESYALALIPFATEENPSFIQENESLQWMGKYPGASTPLKKINSCVQAHGGLDIVPDGVQALASMYYPFAAFRHQALNYFVFENVRDELGLRNSGIYFGLKFGRNDNSNKKALQGFFAYLLTLAALEARAHGIGEVKLTATYPNQAGYGNLQQQLLSTLTEVSPRFFNNAINKAIAYRRETTSAIGYFRYKTPPGLSLDTGFVVVDIGGGTTDISLVKSTRNGQIKTSRESIRFAGDALIRQTLVFAALKYQAYAKQALKAMFDSGSNSNIADRLAGIFETKLKKARMTAPFAADTYKSKYPEVAEVFDAFLREPGMTPDYSRITPPETLSKTALQDYEKILEHFSYHIKLRYLLLFYFVAYHIKAHENEVAFGNKIFVSLAGFGSRGLCFCTGKTFDEEKASEINESNFTRLVAKIFDKVLQKPVELVTPTASDKEEVVVGALTSYAQDMISDNKPGDDGTPDPDAVIKLDRRDPALQGEYTEHLDNLIAVFDEVLNPKNNSDPDVTAFYERVSSIWADMKAYIRNKGDEPVVWLEEAQALYKEKGDCVVTLPENLPVAAAILTCFHGLSAI